MQPVLNIQDVRDVERALDAEGVSLSELMYRAGVAASREVRDLNDDGLVTVFVGTGNNGGDGWVAAADLLRHGVPVRVVTPVEASAIPSALARAAAEDALRQGVEALVKPTPEQVYELLGQSGTVLDAIFGTGFHGEPGDPYSWWIDAINASGVSVVAVDVPSGLSAQSGHAAGACVSADVTVTMIALKPGLVSDQGRDACGSIVVAPLAEQTERLAVGADPLAFRTDLEDYLDVLDTPSSSVDKFTRGSVLVVGGSSRFPGAAMMAARAAARAGAGYVTLAVPSPIAPIVQMQMVEIPVVALPSLEDGTISPRAADLVRRLASKRSATLVGPGMRATSGTANVVTKLLEADIPLVIDADGLNCLAHMAGGHLDAAPQLLRRRCPVVLTPHRGELGRLVGCSDNMPDSLASCIEAARSIVWEVGGRELCVVAKGPATACVGVEVALLPKPGPAALATAGSGDVLAGIMASLLAQGLADGDAIENLPLVAALACEVHAYAGSIAAERYGSRGVMAGDVIEAIGLASDTLAEHIMFPDAAFAD